MWYNALVVRILRSPLHPLLGKNLLLVSYKGRTSGKIYTVPVNGVWLDENNPCMITVTSRRNRTWWRNLRNNAGLKVYLSNKEYQAHAEVIEDDKRVAEVFTRYFQRYPGHARYFNVHLGSTNQPLPDDLSAACHDKVIIQIQLPQT